MSSDPDVTPVSSRPARPRPPRLFAFAMVLCMALGFGGTMNGCNVLQFYRSSVREEPPMPDGDEAEREKWREGVRASWDVFDRARATQVPLAAADLVLSALLMMVAWRALQGRPGTRGLAAQAVAVNGAYALLEYALSTPVRAAFVSVLVEHMPRSSLRLPTPLPDEQLSEALHQALYFLLFRAPFGFKLVSYSLSLIALSLPSARAYLEDVAAGDNAEA
ncbi:MAG: hypothetical protein MUF34_11725 [Polyangiaceae bacterium]|jgi:hypothetical protein|nr:hypothetical protein [Polyangiaceae bacterium]